MIKAEIIAVGTEILMGQVVNTNATFLSRELQNFGVFVYHHTVVGDNQLRIKKAITAAEKRSDLILFTGGLGPTEDDITKQVLATHLSKKLVIDDFHLQKIMKYYAEKKMAMTVNNEQQALVIEGSTVLKNDSGFAAGMWLKGKTNTYALLPGPPSELKPMFTNYVSPLLRRLEDDSLFLESKIMHFYGIGESQLAHDLSDLVSNQTNPTIATYANNHEVSIRLTATANTKAKALSLLKPIEKEIISRAGQFLYGYGKDTLAGVVVQQLVEKKLTLSAAESLIAGLFQAELGRETGISPVYKGGIITYSTEMKMDILKVKKETIDCCGVVSENCAKEMAENIRKICKTEIGISFTGVAGPDSLEGKTAGTVWIGFSVKGKTTQAFKYVFGYDRNSNQTRAVKEGLQIIRNFLDNLSE